MQHRYQIIFVVAAVFTTSARNHANAIETRIPRQKAGDFLSFACGYTIWNTLRKQEVLRREQLLHRCEISKRVGNGYILFFRVLAFITAAVALILLSRATLHINFI